MSDTTPNLSLPYILPAQAQKHVTHNEALRVLDLITQLSVGSASMTVPPAETVEGRRYIVPASATGLWAGKSGKIAILEQAAWSFLAPDTGWIAWVEDATELRIFDGTDWVTPDVSIPSVLTELGIGISPDVSNRFAVSSPASLFNHAGAGHQIKVNKAGPSDTASLLFQSDWSGRAEMGLTGDDGFQIKVSADGSAFSTALFADGATGQITLPQPVILPLRTTDAPTPAADTISVYAAKRAGAGGLEVVRPSGRNFALQPSFATNRIASWAPNVTTTITQSGMPRSVVGTVSTPTISGGSLANSMRRWRVTSAATANAPADERSATWVCWRGNAAGLGGFTFVDRLSIVTIQPTAVGFFGLINTSTALAGTTTLSSLGACAGIGFDRSVDTNWQILFRDGTAALSKINLGSSFQIDNTSAVITLFLYAPPNGSSVWVEVVEEVTGTRVSQELTSNIPLVTQFLSPRHYMTNLGTAAAIAYDCSGLYIETDY